MVFDDLIETMKASSREELRKILLLDLREDQFKITEQNDGWDVKVKYVPPNVKIPAAIGYWKVRVAVDKKI